MIILKRSSCVYYWSGFSRLTYLSFANSVRCKSSTHHSAKRRGVFSTLNQWELWIFWALCFMYTVQSNEEKQTARQIHEFCVNNWVQYTQRFFPTSPASVRVGWKMPNAEFVLCCVSQKQMFLSVLVLKWACFWLDRK